MDNYLKNMYRVLFFASLVMFFLGHAQEVTKSNSSTINSSTEESCQCVPFYQCNNDYGADVITLRLKEACEKDFEVCCDIETSESHEKLQNVTKTKPCGVRNSQGLGYRISDDPDNTENEAYIGEFPWMVAILTEEIKENGHSELVYVCGGSLIHPKAVLTAAHCLSRKDVKKLRARAGEWDFQLSNELYDHQDRKVKKVITHEKFHRGTARNDISILILEEPFTMEEHLGVVCLPQAVGMDTNCIVTGWGKNALDGEHQQRLKQIEVPIVPQDKCQEALRKTRLGNKFKLHESFICAGGIKGDSCEGDGGGPLVCPYKDGNKTRYQQVGIVAWGVDCATETPGVYANVKLFKNWIEDQLKKTITK